MTHAGDRDGSKLNILLVDDQPAKLLTYEAMLAQLGENLIKAQTAREALAHLLREDFAVVLIDVNMPELDGFELAAMIRQHPRCQQTAIIFVSAVHLTDLDRAARATSRARSTTCRCRSCPRSCAPRSACSSTSTARPPSSSSSTARWRSACPSAPASSRPRSRQLREREHRLRLQGEALAEADRRKNEFLAMLAHELRNPLQPIRTAVELLRQAEGDARRRLQWARNVVDRQVNQLVRLVDDLLDASRISSGKLELRKDVVDLVPIVARRDRVESPARRAQAAAHRCEPARRARSTSTAMRCA